MTPAYAKLARTVFFMTALGLMTAFVVSESGSFIVLTVYVLGTLVVYGVDHMQVQYGKLNIELGKEENHSQTTKDTEDIE